MCLYSKQILPRRATKDIVVYKEVMYVDNLKKVYKTPFAGYYILLSEFGNIKSAIGTISILRSTIPTQKIHTKIGSGYFHCHRCMPLLKGKSRYGAYSTDDGRIKYNTQWRIVECTIPKGSLYWIGVDYDICSDKLIFNKVLSEEEINQILDKQ